MKSGSGAQWTIQGRLHTFITFMQPYALRMQPYAVRMHFFGSSKKPIKSKAERTSEKPYALYAPLLGVGVFSAFFLLRELHTVHTAAYADAAKQDLALLPVGIRASPAREIIKCIRRCIRISGRKAPIDPLLLEYPDSGYWRRRATPLPPQWPSTPPHGVFWPLRRASAEETEQSSVKVVVGRSAGRPARRIAAGHGQ